MILALCFLTFQSITLGKSPSAEIVPFLGIEQVVSMIEKTVFAVQINVGEEKGSNIQQWQPLGSGFLVQVEPNVILGITCAHVVAAAEEANKPLFIGLSTDKGYRRFKCKVAGKDPNTDVALLMPLKEDPNEKISLREERAFLVEGFGDVNSLIKGRGVITAGFPLSLGVEADKEYPVIRMGIVAQYTGRKTFLIDGAANPGNSGSPVFSVKFPEFQLLGMITSYKSDSIDLFDNNHNLIAKIPYNSGLSQAVTADEIRKCIEKAKR
jgi:S1-C subfamily serine protease